MQSKIRSRLFQVLKLAISAGLLGYLVHQAVADEQFTSLVSTKKNWALLALGFLCSVSAIAVSIYRWKCLVNAVGLPLSLKDAFRIGAMGQFFNVVAFGTLGADALRAFYLGQKFNQRKSEAIVTVIADRFTGLLTMLFLGAVAFFVLERFELIQVDEKYQNTLRKSGRIVSLVAVGFTAAMAATVFFPRLQHHPLMQRIYQIPKIGNIARRTTDILAIFQNRPAVLFYSFLLSVVVNVCFLLAIYLIAQGISRDAPSLASHAFIEPIAMVCNAIPLPGGLGGMEFALALLYRALGSQSGIVVAFAYRLSLLIVAFVGGILWFLYRKQVDQGDLAHALDG